MVDLFKLLGWLLLIAAVVLLVATTVDWLTTTANSSYEMFQEGLAHRHTTYGLRAPMSSPGDAVSIFITPVFKREWDLIMGMLGVACVTPFAAWLVWRVLKQVLT